MTNTKSVIEFGLEVVKTCDPKALKATLMSEIFPQLSIAEVLKNFGPKFAIIEYKHRAGVSMAEASAYIKEAFPVTLATMSEV